MFMFSYSVAADDLGRPRRPLSPRPLALAAFVATAALSTLPAQEQAGWVLQAPDGARAYFEVLSGLLPTAPGPFSYYRSGAARGDAGLRRSLAAPQFEVLHFVPLYAPLLDPSGLAQALRAAASDPSLARAPFLDAVLRNTLSPADRPVLARLSALVVEVAATLPPSRADAPALQRRWADVYRPALASFLEAEHLSSGTVLLVDRLGAEGRIFAGRPEADGDNVIAVGLWPGAAVPDAPLLAMLRELCFPLVTRSALLVPAGDRRAATTEASYAAVRCGARLADAVSPTTGMAYRRLWSTAGSISSAAFEAQFPIGAARWHALSAELDRSLGPPPLS